MTLVNLQLSKETVTPTTSQAPTAASTAVKLPSTPAVKYITLGSFSWEQDNDKVKVRMSIKLWSCVVWFSHHIGKIKPTSFDIKFHDVQGKNYRCAIPKLNKDIVPENCKVLVKPTRVVVTLIKASKGNWLDLYYKEDKVIYPWLRIWTFGICNYELWGVLWLNYFYYHSILQLKPNLDKERDPMAGIMDLMKVRFSCFVFDNLWMSNMWNA